MMRKHYYGEPVIPDHDYSSTQVNLPPDVARKIKAIAAKIPDPKLGDDGREKEPHITVKYGLHDANPSAELRRALSGFGAVEATLKRTSMFTNNSEYDVVKIDVDSPSLHKLNALISKSTSVTDTHPTYKPHATVAYVKKGAGKEYSGSAAMDGTKLKFDSIVFSGKDHTKHTISLL